MYKRARWVVSLMLVCAMLFSMMSVAWAAEAEDSGESTSDFSEQGGPEQDNSALDNPDPSDFFEQDSSNQDDLYKQADSADFNDELDGLIDSAGLVMMETYDASDFSIMPMTDAACPTYQEAYEIMIALQDQYPEGMPWDNRQPFDLDNAYNWCGGFIKGANGGVGCAAFVFLLSDAVFGNLPARVFDYGEFTFADVQVGDILRITAGHFVIVLQKSVAGVIVAEANYNKTVHWGRAISAAEVENSVFMVTRYPANYVAPDTPGANDVVQSGEVGGLHWTLTGAGTLTITGEGDMPDFTEANPAPWSEFTAQTSTIVIEDGVTSIGEYAFHQNQALSVYIPAGVTRIGQFAFYQAALLGVTIPSSVETIGKCAFYHCKQLTSVSVEDGVSIIGEQAFKGCTTLQYVDFPSSITACGEGAFMDCSQVVQVRFRPSNHEVAMGDSLFARCWNLRFITLPQKMDCISAGLFASCGMLTYLYIPATIAEIKSVGYLNGSPFAGCDALSLIEFGGSEASWSTLGGNPALTHAGLMGRTTVKCNVEFNDPFAVDPDDPGDFHPVEPDPDQPDNPGPDNPDPDQPDNPDPDKPNPDNPDPDQPDKPDPDNPTPDQPKPPVDPENPDTPTNPDPDTPDTPVMPSEPEQPGRPTPPSQPSIPSWPTYPGNSGGDNYPGASNKPGNTPPKPNVGADNTDLGATNTTEQAGPSATVTTQADGTIIATSSNIGGAVSIEVKLSAQALTNVKHQSAVVLPISPVLVSQDLAMAPSVTVFTESQTEVKVAIPLAQPSATTVALLVQADGSAQLIKTAVVVENQLITQLSSGATIKLVDNRKTFADIPEGAWLEEAVAFVTARELFAGTTATTFSPDKHMTRAMLLTVLARLADVETNGGDTWYAKAADWAVALGISDGSNLSADISREQLVVMLWRYCGSPATDEFSVDFTDAAEISTYAEAAMCWAVSHGIIHGIGEGKLYPQGPASRAQVAQILQNFITSLVLNAE